MDGSSQVVATNSLAEAEAAEDAALAQATTPRALVRLAAPMSIGLLRVAPPLPEFLAKFSEVPIDLHLSDAMVDRIGEASTPRSLRGGFVRCRVIWSAHPPTLRSMADRGIRSTLRCTMSTAMR
jgi:hypothetical protein